MVISLRTSNLPSIDYLNDDAFNQTFRNCEGFVASRVVRNAQGAVGYVDFVDLLSAQKAKQLFSGWTGWGAPLAITIETTPQNQAEPYSYDPEQFAKQQREAGGTGYSQQQQAGGARSGPPGMSTQPAAGATASSTQQASRPTTTAQPTATATGGATASAPSHLAAALAGLSQSQLTSLAGLLGQGHRSIAAAATAAAQTQQAVAAGNTSAAAKPATTLPPGLQDSGTAQQRTQSSVPQATSVAAQLISSLAGTGALLAAQQSGNQTGYQQPTTGQQPMYLANGQLVQQQSAQQQAATQQQAAGNAQLNLAALQPQLQAQLQALLHQQLQQQAPAQQQQQLPMQHQQPQQQPQVANNPPSYGVNLTYPQQSLPQQGLGLPTTNQQAHPAYKPMGAPPPHTGTIPASHTQGPPDYNYQPPQQQHPPPQQAPLVAGGALPPPSHSQPPPADTAPPLPYNATACLFIDGLPSDITKREAAHIFRPIQGYKELRLVQKERVSLLFVDFVDAHAATVAMNLLQGYKLDLDDDRSVELRPTYARPQGTKGKGGAHGDRNRDGGHSRHDDHTRSRDTDTRSAAPPAAHAPAGAPQPTSTSYDPRGHPPVAAAAYDPRTQDYRAAPPGGVGGVPGPHPGYAPPAAGPVAGPTAPQTLQAGYASAPMPGAYPGAAPVAGQSVYGQQAIGGAPAYNTYGQQTVPGPQPPTTGPYSAPHQDTRRAPGPHGPMVSMPEMRRGGGPGGGGAEYGAGGDGGGRHERGREGGRDRERERDGRGGDRDRDRDRDRGGERREEGGRTGGSTRGRSRWS